MQAVIHVQIEFDISGAMPTTDSAWTSYICGYVTYVSTYICISYVYMQRLCRAWSTACIRYMWRKTHTATYDEHIKYIQTNCTLYGTASHTYKSCIRCSNSKCRVLENLPLCKLNTFRVAYMDFSMGRCMQSCLLHGYPKACFVVKHLTCPNRRRNTDPPSQETTLKMPPPKAGIDEEPLGKLQSL